ncbi:hypothetical protein BU17DRAFT_61925 [Hysterangium stoloniferum]|nr:hypothetical protein BU17DRAFT_61925 [Hysterangium stoloniferum]
MLACNWITKISTLYLDIPFLYRSYAMRICGLQSVHGIQEREVFEVVGDVDEGQRSYEISSIAVVMLINCIIWSMKDTRNDYIGFATGWAVAICSTMGCRLLLNMMKCQGDLKTNTRRPPGVELMNMHPSRS